MSVFLKLPAAGQFYSFCLVKGHLSSKLRLKIRLKVPQIGKNRFTRVFGLGIFSCVLKTTSVKV